MVRSKKTRPSNDRLARTYLTALARSVPPSGVRQNATADAAPPSACLRIRADVAACAILLARAVEREDGLSAALRIGSPVVTIETRVTEMVLPVKKVVKICLLSGREERHEGKAWGSGLAFVLVRDGTEVGRMKNAENHTIVDALHASTAIVGIAPDPEAQLPSHLLRVTDHRLSLGHLGASGVTLVIEAVTGARPTVPIEEQLARSLDLIGIVLCIRPGRSADECVDGIRKLASARGAVMTGPRLEELVGYGEAKTWGLNLVADLKSRLSFDDIETSVLLYGPPGVGKTRFAAALAAAAELPLIETSVATWNSFPYLSGTLGEMRSVYARAKEFAPCVYFCDELDGIGDRATTQDQEYALYYSQIQNLALELFAKAAGDKSVLVCATNFPDRIDAALLRSGRIDRKIEIGLPDVTALTGIFRYYLHHELEDVDLTEVAVDAIGHTGADVQSWVRAARGKARRAGRALCIEDLANEIRGGGPPAPEWIRRSGAIHEAGHLVGGMAVGIFEPNELSLNDRGGRARMVHHFGSVQTKAGLESYIIAVLSGRAAEEAILGTEAVTVGSGAGPSSDLSIATSIALDLELAYGMGVLGLAQFGNGAGQVMTHDPAVVKAVRRRLDSCFSRARSIITANRRTVTAIATALERSRHLDRAAILRLLEIHPIKPSDGTRSSRKAPRSSNKGG
jgi:cell division protease FtsH